MNLIWREGIKDKQYLIVPAPEPLEPEWHAVREEKSSPPSRRITKKSKGHKHLWGGSGHRTLGTGTEKMALGWPQVEIEAAAIVGDYLIFLRTFHVCPTRFCPTTIQNERPYMVHGARLAKCYPGLFTIQVLWCNSQHSISILLLINVSDSMTSWFMCPIFHLLVHV